MAVRFSAGCRRGNGPGIVNRRCFMRLRRPIVELYGAPCSPRCIPRRSAVPSAVRRALQRSAPIVERYGGTVDKSSATRSWRSARRCAWTRATPSAPAGGAGHEGRPRGPQRCRRHQSRYAHRREQRHGRHRRPRLRRPRAVFRDRRHRQSRGAPCRSRPPRGDPRRPHDATADLLALRLQRAAPDGRQGQGRTGRRRAPGGRARRRPARARRRRARLAARRPRP